MAMHIKLYWGADLISLGKALVPEASVDSFEWDYENVYEWMYVQISTLDYSLNVSRKHGQADIDDKLLENADPQELNGLVKPGEVSIIGWDRIRDYRVENLPEWLPQSIANHLCVEVQCFDQQLNIEQPAQEPIAVVRPR